MPASAKWPTHEIGRLVEALQDIGQLDNTLIFYIVGDNGASAEGGMNGMFNEMTYFNGVPETVADMLKHYDELGGPDAYPHMPPAGRLRATRRSPGPSRSRRTTAARATAWSSPGPEASRPRDEVRSQFHHVIDVAPTMLEAAGLPEPKMVNGTPQEPIEGVSMLYTFDDPKPKDRHTTQYFEIFGNRAIYHDGWFAGTIHRAPWERPRARFCRTTSGNCTTPRTDFSLATTLAAKNPAKLKEMQELFLQEAIKNHVLPIDDRGIERLNAGLAGRPDLMGGRTSLTVYPGMTGMMENAFINVKNRSHSITAEVEIPSHANGVIICQGGRFGGWTLYLKDGKPKYAYNWVGLKMYTISGKQPLAPGKTTIRFEFAYDGGDLGAGGLGKLFVNGNQVAQGRIDKTNPLIFSPDEAADVGVDEGTPVTEDYRPKNNKFNGTIDKVVIDVKPIGAGVKDKADKASQQLMMDKAAED